MKIQTLALLIVAGGMLASGYVIGPAPGATVATITTAAQAGAAAPDKLAPTPQPTTKVRTMRPPVPFQVGTHDQYFTSPPADVVATDSKPLDDPAQTQMQSQVQPQVDIGAKAAIEQDGYRNVRALTMGADGTWRGRAMRGSTEIAVSVDANGSVSAD
jgi:hypothetical protein